MSRRRWVVLMGALALVVAACADGEAGETTTTVATTETPDTTAAPDTTEGTEAPDWSGHHRLAPHIPTPWANLMTPCGSPNHFERNSPTGEEKTRWNTVGVNPGFGAPIVVFITTSPVINPGC